MEIPGINKFFFSVKIENKINRVLKSGGAQFLLNQEKKTFIFIIKATLTMEIIGISPKN